VSESTRGMIKSEPREKAAVKSSTRFDKSQNKAFSGQPRNQQYHYRPQHQAQGAARVCFKCGNTYPHQGLCPADGKECHLCKKKGHFARCCKSKKQEQVNAITAAPNERENEESSDEESQFKAEDYVKRYMCQFNE
jgi:hypothetical protein